MIDLCCLQGAAARGAASISWISSVEHCPSRPCCKLYRVERQIRFKALRGSRHLHSGAEHCCAPGVAALDLAALCEVHVTRVLVVHLWSAFEGACGIWPELPQPLVMVGVAAQTVRGTCERCLPV